MRSFLIIVFDDFPLMIHFLFFISVRVLCTWLDPSMTGEQIVIFGLAKIKSYLLTWNGGTQKPVIRFIIVLN